jgi:hypothetical protein
MDMKLVEYDSRSPYYYTRQESQQIDYLDVWTPISIQPNPDDMMVRLENRHAGRPDLLSYDLYGTPSLWWVFALRNPDVIKDPIYDFKPDLVIYAPQRQNMGTYA